MRGVEVVLREGVRLRFRPYSLPSCAGLPGGRARAGGRRRSGGESADSGYCLCRALAWEHKRRPLDTVVEPARLRPVSLDAVVRP